MLLSRKKNDYSISLTTKQTGSKLVLTSKTGIFSSKLMQRANGNYYEFKILFDSTLESNKNTKYEIKAINHI